MNLNTLNDNYIYKYLSSTSDVRGIVHISHGKAEHIGRYKWLISMLNNNGYHVISIDHRGHGNRINNKRSIGIFSNSFGWKKVVKDLKTIIDNTKKEYPTLKQYIFGHSMGSWIALSLFKERLDISGMILSGSSKFPYFLIVLQRLIIKLDILFFGQNKINNIMETLSTKRFNNYFKPNRTQSDWISTDDANVDNYVDDKLCGYKVTSGLWLDMVNGIEEVFNKKNYDELNKDVPILIISGSDDPVGDFTKGVTSLYNYLKSIFSNVELKILSSERHEVFSGIKKNDAYNSLKLFLDKNL